MRRALLDSLVSILNAEKQAGPHIYYMVMPRAEFKTVSFSSADGTLEQINEKMNQQLGENDNCWVEEFRAPRPMLGNFPEVLAVIDQSNLDVQSKRLHHKCLDKLGTLSKFADYGPRQTVFFSVTGDRAWDIKLNNGQVLKVIRDNMYRLSAFDVKQVEDMLLEKGVEMLDLTPNTQNLAGEIKWTLENWQRWYPQSRKKVEPQTGEIPDEERIIATVQLKG